MTVVHHQLLRRLYTFYWYWWTHFFTH